MKKHFCNERGLALAIIIMVFAIVSILGTIGLSVSLSEVRQSLSTQTYEENYYYARSATDTVSSNLIKMIEDNYNLAQELKTTPPSITLAEYEEDRDKLIDILEGESVVVSGIGMKDIITNISSTVNGDGTRTVIVESKYENEGRTSISRVKLGDISMEPVDAIQSGTASAIHAWGELYFEELPFVDGGNYTYGEVLKVKKDSYTEVTNIPQYTVLTPPEAKAAAAVSIPDNSSYIVTSANNGFHGDVAFGTKTLTIDATLAPVTLGFSRLAFNGNSDITINVIGDYDVAIFLIEDANVDYSKHKDGKKVTDFEPAPYLFYAKNGFGVRVANPDKPNVYFISETNDSDSADFNFYMKNSTKLEAYFYLPGMKFYVKNTAQSAENDIVGSVWATNISMGNNMYFKYIPPESSLMPNIEESGLINVTTEAIKINGIDVGVGTASRLWIK